MKKENKVIFYLILNKYNDEISKKLKDKIYQELKKINVDIRVNVDLVKEYWKFPGEY